jgi:quinol monooxygenase YgiN
MSERIMFATMKAQPGKLEELKAVFGPMFEQAAKEQGTLLYTLVEGDEPDTLFFYEHYTDQSAMDAHMASGALAQVHQALGGLLADGGAVTGTVVQKLR